MSRYTGPRRAVHRLDSVEMKLHFSQDGTVRVEAHGRSDTKRGYLWSLVEEFGADNPVYGPTDALHHIALATSQDRPNSQERVFFSMNGGIGWVEESLPFPE